MRIMRTTYFVKDKNTGKTIKGDFPTKDAAEVWCETEGIDYDHFQIMRQNEEDFLL